MQELVDTNLLTFKELGPNVKKNPLVGHLPSINSIEGFVETKMIKEVEKVKTLMLIIHSKLIKVWIIQEVHGFCEICLSSTDECEKLKKCLQELINQGTIHIGRSKSGESISTLEPLEIPYLKQDAQDSPLVIYFPAPFTFESTKVVPGTYGATTYVRDKLLVLESNVTNIPGIRGMKRSGRVLALEKS